MKDNTELLKQLHQLAEQHPQYEQLVEDCFDAIILQEIKIEANKANYHDALKAVRSKTTEVVTREDEDAFIEWKTEYLVDHGTTTVAARDLGFGDHIGLHRPVKEIIARYAATEIYWTLFYLNALINNKDWRNK